MSATAVLSVQGKWVADKFLGLPDEVNVFYREGRDLYLKLMDAVLDKVAVTVEKGLNEAKEEISKGRKAVQDHVNKQPANLRKAAQDAAQTIQSQFDQLEQSVNDKQNQLIESLAQKYNEKLQAIEAMQAENRGLVDQALDAVAGVIKTILELKNMLMGVLAKAASAIKKIIKDPIGFLGNLVAGVKQGFLNFVGNIAAHLQKGLMGWLFGAIAEAGIQLPESFDLKGILGLVMQVLGMTWAFIRAHAVKILGEPVVKALETTAEIFKILITQGPAGLWEYIKEQLSNLKDVVIEGIKSFVSESIIKAGVTWIIGLLNPAGAFIKACKAIYDIIMFFVERGSQIIALVNAVTDSVSAIAPSAIGAAASAVENALSKAVPVVISFLAALLGVTGITGKIRSIIEKVQAPVSKAIDWVINKAYNLVKAAGKLLGFGKDKTKQGDTSEAKAKMSAAVSDVQKLMTAPGATVKSVEDQLPAIKQKYTLQTLDLVRDKEGVFHAKATVNPTLEGPPGILFTDDELKELDAVAKNFCEQILAKERTPKDRGIKAQFEADREGFIKAGKVDKPGDIVEAAGTPSIQELAAEVGLTVVRNARLLLFDVDGKSVGGKTIELDFLVLGTQGVQEVVSAKTQPKSVDVKPDIKMLKSLVEMPLDPAGMAAHIKGNYDPSSVYDRIASAKVSSSLGSQSLAAFRSQYLSKVPVERILITPLTPKLEKSDPRTERKGLQLRVTRAELFAKVVELTKKYIP